jgi:hypothetical protein
MVSEKATYWAAAAVMIFGLAHRGVPAGRDCARGWMDRFASVSDQISGQAGRLLARTEMAAEQRDAGVDRGRTEMAHARQQLACMQAALARRQGDFARFEGGRARLAATQQMRHARLGPGQYFVVNPSEKNVLSSSIVIDGGTL